MPDLSGIGKHVGRIYEGDAHTFGKMTELDGRMVGYFPCRICGSGMLGDRVYAHRNSVAHVECAAEYARAVRLVGLEELSE